MTIGLRKNDLGILGISKENPSDKEIKAAYKMKVLKMHPDKNLGKNVLEVTQRFIEMNNAYLRLISKEYTKTEAIQRNEQYWKVYAKNNAQKEKVRSTGSAIGSLVFLGTTIIGSLIFFGVKMEAIMSLPSQPTPYPSSPFLPVIMYAVGSVETLLFATIASLVIGPFAFLFGSIIGEKLALFIHGVIQKFKDFRKMSKRGTKVKNQIEKIE